MSLCVCVSFHLFVQCFNWCIPNARLCNRSARLFVCMYVCQTYPFICYTLFISIQNGITRIFCTCSNNCVNNEFSFRMLYVPTFILCIQLLLHICTHYILLRSCRSCNGHSAMTVAAHSFIWLAHRWICLESNVPRLFNSAQSWWLSHPEHLAMIGGI